MSDSPATLDQIESAVRQVFIIEDTTIGEERDAFLYRFRGTLRGSNSVELYDRLDALVKLLNLTPLFRKQDDRHEIQLITRLPEATTGKSSLNIILFIITLISVWFTGGLLSAQTLSPNWGENIRQFIITGWPFALSML
ncbi:MAG TPA: hypothetical protein PKD55_10065, partial [Bellilinea sp.]|nr:hypothetical protein [Bellilinea sp.]